jgi:hypothetical protein
VTERVKAVRANEEVDADKELGHRNQASYQAFSPYYPQGNKSLLLLYNYRHTIQQTHMTGCIIAESRRLSY